MRSNGGPVLSDEIDACAQTLSECIQTETLRLDSHSDREFMAGHLITAGAVFVSPKKMSWHETP